VKKLFFRPLATLFLSFLFFSVSAQKMNKELKPYKLLTNGRQINIRSNKNIQQVLLWTTDGNRVVEQRGIFATSFKINVPINRNTFFMMIELMDGKVYTEKIGLRE
jgi:hypothetical protein